MTKRSLILYYSLTGNTEKVVWRFKQVFEKRGWECDLLKITNKTDVTQSPSPFDVDKYDFICVGSGSYKSQPNEKIIDIMRNNPRDAHYGPRPPIGKAGGDGPQGPMEGPPGEPPAGPPPEPPAGQTGGTAPVTGHRRIKLGPDAKKGIVFVTYAGHEFGPPEAVPALESLTLEMEHMYVKCIGKFSCPGKFGATNKDIYYKDIMERPNARDLRKAEIFLEETLEEIE